MNKEDLIYDTVCRIEKRLETELLPIKKDLDDLKNFKATLIGACATVSVIGTFLIDSVKSFFLR